MHWTAATVFLVLFLLVTVLGFVAARWRRGDLDRLDEWGLAGRRFGTVVTWFLLGGDLYTAYTFIAVPALVFGAGPIGIMAAQWARAAGAGHVIIVDPIARKLDLAHKLGFEYGVDPRQPDAVSAIEELTKGLGAAICIEAAGVPQALVQAMRAVRHGGRIVILGNPSADVTLPAELISRIMRHEVQIFGTWNSDYGFFREDDDWHRTLAAMASGTIDVKHLVTHRVPLDRAFGALRMIKDQSEFYCKVLIHPEGGVNKSI